MRYSIEPKDRIYIKRFGFLCFAKNLGKNLSNKYSQKSLDSAKKSTKHTIITASKRVIQKTADATWDLIDDKTAEKIKNASKKSSYIQKKKKKKKKKLITKYQKKIQIFKKKTTNY